MKRPKALENQKKPVAGADEVKKIRRWKHKTKVLRDIRKAQNSSADKFALRKTIFGRAVRKEILNFNKPETRITRTAMYLLQQSVEDIVHRLLNDANVLCIGLTRRKTLATKHVYAAMHVWSNARNTDLIGEFKECHPDDAEVASLKRDFVPAITPRARLPNLHKKEPKQKEKEEEKETEKEKEKEKEKDKSSSSSVSV